MPSVTDHPILATAAEFASGIANRNREAFFRAVRVAFAEFQRAVVDPTRAVPPAALNQAVAVVQDAVRGALGGSHRDRVMAADKLIQEGIVPPVPLEFVQPGAALLVSVLTAYQRNSLAPPQPAVGQSLTGASGAARAA
jgi:hypothetical protein